jgi:hypothetical protein
VSAATAEAPGAAPPAAPAPASAPAPAAAAEDAAPELVLRLRGAVVGAAHGFGVAGLEVRLAPPAGAEAARAATGAGGEFTLELRGEGWSLGDAREAQVVDPRTGVTRFSGLARLEQDLVLVASEALRLRGTIESDYPWPQAPLVEIYEPRRRAQERPRRVASVRADAGGAFEVEGALAEPAGALRVEADLGPAWAGAEVPLEALLSEGGAQVPLWVATVDLRVVDDAGIALEGARVTLAPIDGAVPRPPLTAETDARGAARIEAGDGPIELWVAAERFEAHSERLVLREPSVEVEVVLERSAAEEEVFGTVLDLQDRPVAGARVVAEPAAAGEVLARLVATATVGDERGRFRLRSPGLPPLRLVASLEGSIGEPALVVPDGAPVLLRLARAGTLAVQALTDALPAPFSPGGVAYVAIERASGTLHAGEEPGLPLHLALPPGEVDVYLALPGFAGCGEGFALVEAGRASAALVPLRAAAWIEGRVRYADGETYAGLDVVALSSWPRAACEALCGARTESDGRFRVLASSPDPQLEVRYRGELLDRRAARAGTQVEIVLE